MVKCILLLAIIVIAVENAECKLMCSKGEDCVDDHCCLNMNLLHGICVPRIKPGSICMESKEVFGKYMLACPCMEGLECKKVEGKKGIGKIIRKCHDPNDSKEPKPDSSEEEKEKEPEEDKPIE